MRKDGESVFAIVGGGRWGRVLASVLADMQHLPFDRVVVVSQANREAVTQLLSTSQFKRHPSFHIVPTLDQLLADYPVRAAIVVNAANQHFDTALQLIENRVHILVEKPVVLSIEQAKILIRKAKENKVCLVPGLNYRFCSYIHNFSELITQLKKKPQSFLLEWSDQAGEMRYGEVKKYDRSINVAQDVMPHIWSILSIIFRPSTIYVDSCLAAYEGRFADFTAIVDEIIKGRIILERDAAQRQRRLTVQYDSNNKETLVLDFSIEPGTISLGKETQSGDLHWESTSRPLMRQLTYFLSHFANGISSKTDIQACLDSVSFSERASFLMRKRETSSVPYSGCKEIKIWV